MTLDWVLPWWRHMGGGELLVLALRDGDRLVALAPLFVHRADGRRRLSFLGSGVSDELDLLAEPGAAAVAARLVFEHLRARLPLWDEIALTELPGGSPQLAATNEAAEANGAGTLLLAHAIGESVREGARTFDFLRGDEAYKLGWGTRPAARHRLLVEPCASS